MHRRYAAALLALSSALAVADAEEKPKPIPIESPLGQLQLAVTDLANNVRVEDAPFVRYLSLWTAGYRFDPPEIVGLPGPPIVAKTLIFDPARLARFRTEFRWWLNHMSGSKSPVREVEIDGPRGTVQRTDYTTLIRIDIRDAVNWTRTAWILVADRDYLFREPLLPNRETVFGRLVTGIEVNPATFQAGFILNAYQLFRDTIDGDRAQSYYDLLYAAERHPDKDAGKVFIEVTPTPADPGPEPQKPEERPWPGGAWTGDDADKGKVFPAGSFLYTPRAELEAWEKAHAEWRAAKAKAVEVKPAQPVEAIKTGQAVPKVALSVNDANGGIKNFPAKGVDFEKRWGVDVNDEDIKKFLIDPRVGGIAAGAQGDARNGSYVALNDRAIRVTTSKLVSGGWGARTFDVFANVGDKDHIERFREIALNQAQADGGEILATLPNGSQAGVLVNAADERVEVAATQLAQIRSEKIDPSYRDVRTMQGCVACHAPNGGFNNFVDQFKESIEKGVRFKILDPKEAQAARDFYLSWSKQVKIWQTLYTEYTAEITGGWTGAEAWLAMREFRDWYDIPVTLEIAAVELGYEVEALRQILLGPREENSPIEARLNQLVVGKGIPRRTWQDEVAFKLILFLDSVRAKDEPIKELLAPQLIEEAIKKFGKVKVKP